jgi:hypothetical protein
MKIQFLAFTLIITFVSSFSFSQDTNLCQGNYYSEEEGAKVLEVTIQKIRDKRDWENYSKMIKEGILEGAELNPLPDKTPLNIIRLDLRNYGSYTVENIAFESRPGVLVTGSLYAPTSYKGKLAGILTLMGIGQNLMIMGGIDQTSKKGRRHWR